MTTPKESTIPGQPAGLGQGLTDGALDDVTGGATMPADIAQAGGGGNDDPGVDLDMVEGSIRLRPGSDTPIVDK